MTVMRERPQASSYLETAAQRMTAADAAEMAMTHFGLRGDAALLSGERDENFLIRADGSQFVLKISHPAELRSAISFHTRALRHVAKADPSLPTPRIIESLNGENEVEIADAHGQVRIARLLSFLPGTMAARLPAITPALRGAIGTVLARFDRALEGFRDPADTFELAWDIAQAAALRPMLSSVADPANRHNAERALDRFERHVAPIFGQLRRQVIHNDLTPFNILVSGPADITGVIDFGDMIHAPLIDDLAIACAYHVARGNDPLASVLKIVTAYHARNPITRAECELIYDLMGVRLAITVLITEWHATRNPQNREYILKNHPTATAGLAQLATIAREDAQARLRRACKLDD